MFTHEISHCAALLLCGIPIERISIESNGAKIQTKAISPWQSIFCSLAGPAGGLILLLVGEIFPQAAICSLILSGYNLLPVFPLDGGRALRSLTGLLLPAPYAETICFIFEMVTFLLIIGLGIVMSFQWNLGILPLFAAALFWLQMLRIKIPCKSNI